MENFIRKVLDNKGDSDSHRYFVRFGKGVFKRRFLLSLNRSKKIKIKGSFELANDFVKFVRENKEIKYSGSILSKNKVLGFEGRKKAGVFVYEIEESSIDEFEGAYYYLLNANDSEIVLKIKKSLPKPGKNEDKIDDSFCSLEVDEKFWPKLKETFFWDVPDCKKAKIEHKLIINDIIFPKDEKDSVKIRELAKRKGKIVRKIEFDGKEKKEEYDVEA